MKNLKKLSLVRIFKNSKNYNLDKFILKGKVGVSMVDESPRILHYIAILSGLLKINIFNNFRFLSGFFKYPSYIYLFNHLLQGKLNVCNTVIWHDRYIIVINL